MTERSGVIFLDDEAAPAGCDGAPYSGHFSRRQGVPGPRSWVFRRNIAVFLGGERYPFRGL